MKYLKALLFLILAVSFYQASAQAHKGLARLTVDSSLAPFYHGVASGDPLSDRVIIWTRVTTQQTGTLTVKWRMATDTLFNNIIRQDSTTTDDTKDYTVKVDVTGLQPGTYYYYQFEFGGLKSLTGRTKTVPVGDNSHLRFAVVSCADYENGYYNAYASITPRNDIDAVIHLGDYIYEYGADVNEVRQHIPTHEILTLEDYRARYSHYRLDNDLMRLHQQYPFITIWDDHETANDSWEHGADNHTPATEGDWEVRKANGKQAYFNWMPIRQQPSPNEDKIYRTIHYGDLAELIFLDTRLEGREEQTSDTTIINDTARTILGAAQRQWFLDRLHDTTGQWKIVAQQIMIAPLKLGNTILNTDQWDDYPADRSRVYNTILNDSIKNVVVLTGDIHTAWANDLKQGSTPVGVEFVTTSITSAGSPLGLSTSAIQNLLPHVRYVNVTEHGYLILDITKTKTQGDFYFVSTIDSQVVNTTLKASWYVNAQGRNLIQGTEAPGLTNVAALAPYNVQTGVGINNEEKDVVILGTYPNPFSNKVMIQYYISAGKPLHAKVYDLSGKLVYQKELLGNTGVNYTELQLNGQQNGNYLLILDDGSNTYQKNIMKFN
jgi:alkaline phosphatase D